MSDNLSLASVDSAAVAMTPRGRPSWSGLLRLGLVAVPVKAYPAIASGSTLHFHQLHAGCGQRIRHEKHCPVHGKLEPGAVVSGFAYARDQYLVLDEAELEKLRPARDRALSLERFIAAGDLDPALFAGRTLYVLPDGLAAQHPYQVVTQLLHERRQWAVGRVVLGGHRQLVLLRPAERVLALHVLYYPAQLRASSLWEADLRPGTVSAEERRLAGQLLDAASQPVVWSAYRDDTAEALQALIEARLEGRTPVVPAAEETPVPDLLQALKQSVAAALRQPRAAPAAVAGRSGKLRSSRRSS